jgi:hypothetical protein
MVSTLETYKLKTWFRNLLSEWVNLYGLHRGVGGVRYLQRAVLGVRAAHDEAGAQGARRGGAVPAVPVGVHALKIMNERDEELSSLVAR